jgi:hypothetical protein
VKAHIERVLLQHANARTNRGFWSVIAGALPVEKDVAAVGGLVAGEDFHQRGFARAVFAEHADDLPAAHGEADVVVGVDGSEALVDVAEFNIHWCSRGF